MSKPEQVELVPYATELLLHLNSWGYLIAIISNQSGIGRGLITVKEARAVHDRFTHLLSDAGVRMDAALYCPHAPEENCLCRKPQPGLLLHATEKYEIDLSASFMVGDKISDCEAGTAAGCRSLLLSSEHSAGQDIPPSYEVFSDLRRLRRFFESKSSRPIREATIIT